MNCIQKVLEPYTGGLEAIHRRPSIGSQEVLELYTRDPQVQPYTGEYGAVCRRDPGVLQMSSKVVHRRPESGGYLNLYTGGPGAVHIGPWSHTQEALKWSHT